MATRTTIPDIPSLKAYIGKPLGESDWYTVTQEQINDFARATGAMIGKAMTGLSRGETGLVLVLVNLQ